MISLSPYFVLKKCRNDKKLLKYKLWKSWKLKIFYQLFLSFYNPNLIHRTRTQPQHICGHFS